MNFIKTVAFHGEKVTNPPIFFFQDSPSLPLPPEVIAPDVSSIAEPDPQPQEDSFRLEFEIAEDSTKRGKPKPVDSRGFTYNVKRRRGNNTDWQCTVRPKVCVVFLWRFSANGIHVNCLRASSACAKRLQNDTRKIQGAFFLDYCSPKDYNNNTPRTGQATCGRTYLQIKYNSL